MKSEVDRPSSRLPIAALLILATALRIAALGQENFWIDEVFQIERARTPLDHLSRILQSLPTSLMLQLGESEFLLRLPSAIFSIADVAALYLLSRRLFEERTALLATLFLALAPMHVWYAQEVRWYSEWSLVTVLAYLALVAGLDRGRLRAWFGFAALSVYNLYLFLLSVVVLACQGLSTGWLLLLRRFGARRIVKATAAFALTLLLAAPFLIPLVEHLLAGWNSRPTGTPRPTQLVALPYTVFTYVAGFSAGPTVRELHFFPGVRTILVEYPEVLAYAVIFGPLVLHGLWRLVRSPAPRPQILVPWVVGVPLLVFAGALITEGTYNIRYTFAALPAFAIVLALGVAELPWPRVRWVALALVLLGFGYSLRNYYSDSRYDKEDVRGAVNYVRASGAPQALFTWAGHMTQPLNYYAGDLETTRFLSCDPETGRVVLEPSRSLTPTQPVWFAVARDWDRIGDDCLEWLLQNREIADSARFAGVELRLLAPREPTVIP